MSVQDRLQDVMRDLFDDDDIVVSAEMTAADVPDWDSLAHVRLIVQIEKEFKVRFASAEITGLENVGALMAVIERKINE